MTEPEKKRMFRGQCLPWQHRWVVSRVGVPSWDPWARGILKRCLDCPKVVAK